MSGPPPPPWLLISVESVADCVLYAGDVDAAGATTADAAHPGEEVHLRRIAVEMTPSLITGRALLPDGSGPSDRLLFFISVASLEYVSELPGGRCCFYGDVRTTARAHRLLEMRVLSGSESDVWVRGARALLREIFQQRKRQAARAQLAGSPSNLTEPLPITAGGPSSPPRSVRRSIPAPTPAELLRSSPPRTEQPSPARSGSVPVPAPDYTVRRAELHEAASPLPEQEEGEEGCLDEEESDSVKRLKARPTSPATGNGAAPVPRRRTPHRRSTNVTSPFHYAEDTEAARHDAALDGASSGSSFQCSSADGVPPFPQKSTSRQHHHGPSTRPAATATTPTRDTPTRRLSPDTPSLSRVSKSAAEQGKPPLSPTRTRRERQSPPHVPRRRSSSRSSSQRFQPPDNRSWVLAAAAASDADDAGVRPTFSGGGDGEGGSRYFPVRASSVAVARVPSPPSGRTSPPSLTLSPRPSALPGPSSLVPRLSLGGGVGGSGWRHHLAPSSFAPSKDAARAAEGVADDTPLRRTLRELAGRTLFHFWWVRKHSAKGVEPAELVGGAAHGQQDASSADALSCYVFLTLDGKMVGCVPERRVEERVAAAPGMGGSVLAVRTAASGTAFFGEEHCKWTSVRDIRRVTRGSDEPLLAPRRASLPLSAASAGALERMVCVVSRTHAFLLELESVAEALNYYLLWEDFLDSVRSGKNKKKEKRKEKERDRKHRHKSKRHRSKSR